MRENDRDDDILYGVNPVREALRKGRPITRVWLARDKKDKATEEIIGHCRTANIPFKATEKSHLDSLCQNAVHQGVVAQTAPKEYVHWKEMLAGASSSGRDPLLVLLDGVEDPQNLGAVLRCVDALGAHGAVIQKNRSAPLTSGAARASAGAWEYVMVDRVTNMSNTIGEMKKEGLWVIGATADAERTIYDMDWSGPVALVLGGESKGLSTLVRSKCDMLVSIPMEGRVNSLNVSAAAAVVLSEINRKRKITGDKPSV